MRVCTYDMFTVPIEASLLFLIDEEADREVTV